jgi:hypothetical protein
MNAVFLGVFLMITGSSSSLSSETKDPLAPYRWRSRLVVIFGASPDDPRVIDQRRVIGHMGADARERDLAVVEFLGSVATAQAMRAKLHVPRDGFQAVLIGKDGGPKLSSSEPIAASKLIETIDTMPMRQQEMRK